MKQPIHTPSRSLSSPAASSPAASAPGKTDPTLELRRRIEARLAEQHLVEALRRGDDAAYETLVRTHGGAMLGTARRILGSEHEAEDAVQDAFVNAFRSIHAFEGGARLSTWLHRVVVTSALMILRRRRCRPETIKDPTAWSMEAERDWVDSPVAYDAFLDEALDRREELQLLRRRIDALPEAYRTVVMLRDVEGLSTREAAAALGCSENAVKIRLHRARQALCALVHAEADAEEVGFVRERAFAR